MRLRTESGAARIDTITLEASDDGRSVNLILRVAGDSRAVTVELSEAEFIRLFNACAEMITDTPPLPKLADMEVAGRA